MMATQNIKKLRVCTKCVMDTTDIDIAFDEEGVCNYCREFEGKVNVNNLDYTSLKNDFDSIVTKIKEDGKGKEYDCLIGVSGGVDSSYVAYLAKEYGLRALAVHLDNGWNSELSVHNIENIIERLGFDLYTYVIDWNEFRALQLAYLRAGVLDLEALTDHAINAVVHKTAYKKGIKYILNGANPYAENILPLSWRYDQKLIDNVNILDIYKKHGTGKKLKSYPLISLLEFTYYTYFKRIQKVSPLRFLPFNKTEAKKIIQAKLNWRDYGGKHYESVITRFYQGYILPKKWGIDKRKAHLSSLIISGNLTREEAVLELNKPIMDAEIFRQDIDYVPKKIGISSDEFEELMQLPNRHHTDYQTNIKFLKRLGAIRRFLGM